ncbi:MerR family transcriptional regulator [Mycobacterium shigaense]|uniref:MerR family transcriptional regulator n=1 Tax=Mycobacterium shigaense TaxID=722731 RepID=UPI000E57C920|nr:MerR family transcriptional regulator [Mycobacterium shigaense]MEA1122204.1 MerR family transcriptional regulator [Mycobacterium shigaense]
MRIGELSRATGVSTRALRYYEDQGLLGSQRRSNGYREYGPEAVRIVAFIQDLYRAGLPSKVIRDILPCTQTPGPATECSALLERIRQVRDELASKERRIAERRQTLEAYLAGPDAPRGLEPTSTTRVSG